MKPNGCMCFLFTSSRKDFIELLFSFPLPLHFIIHIDKNFSQEKERSMITLSFEARENETYALLLPRYEKEIVEVDGKINASHRSL